MKTIASSVGIVLVSIVIISCSTTIPMKEEGSKGIYTSKLDNRRGKFYGVDVKKMANGAPLRIVAMVHTNMDPDKAWRASLYDIDKWSNGLITEVKFTKSLQSKKVVPWNEVASGNARHCLNTEDDLRLIEKMRHVDHRNRFYVYAVDFDKSNVMFPMKNHTGAVTVESDGQGGSLVTFRAYFDRNMNPMSLIFPMMFRKQFVEFMAEFAKVYGGEVVEPKLDL